ncbi:MAG: 50S ribosomal protein L11 methyltransferase [Nitrospirales bacterium]
MVKRPSLLEANIPACVDGAELSGLLACQEFLGLWEQEGALTIYWQGGESSLRQCLHEALAQLNVTIANPTIQVQPVEHQNWNAQWAASVKPIRIGRRIGIRPSWARMDMPEEGIEIVLDPKQAFGTGHHATTHLLLEWLEEMEELSNSRVLDVGTGSGILSMVAVRLGARSALGIDVDPVAVDCAKDYAAINGFRDELVLRCCQIDEVAPQTFDIIVANIDRRTILAISQGFSRLRLSATQVLLSGLLKEDEFEIVEHMTNQGWTQKATREREGWIALQFGVMSSA